MENSIETCMETIYFGNHIDEFIKHCKYTCVENKNSIVKQISGNEYFLVQPDQPTILVCTNSNNQTVYTSFTIGAFHIKIPCHCELKHGNRYVFEPPSPCHLTSAGRYLCYATSYTYQLAHLSYLYAKQDT